jgi:hypothetical protein
MALLWREAPGAQAARRSSLIVGSIVPPARRRTLCRPSGPHVSAASGSFGWCVSEALNRTLVRNRASVPPLALPEETESVNEIERLSVRQRVIVMLEQTGKTAR